MQVVQEKNHHKEGWAAGDLPSPVQPWPHCLLRNRSALLSGQLLGTGVTALLAAKFAHGDRVGGLFVGGIFGRYC
jgi:hypothetical protein